MSDKSLFGGLVAFQEEPVELGVTGLLPGWLSGVLYRVGPAKDKVPRDEGKEPVLIPHWFDAVGAAHRFEVRGGKVLYRNSNIAPQYERRLRERGDAAEMVLFSALDPCKSVFRRFTNVFGPSEKGLDNINVSVSLAFPSIPSTSPTGGEKGLREGLVLKSDITSLLEVDAETLLPGQIFSYADINPKLKGPLSVAHEHFDHQRGAYYNYALELGAKPCFRFFVLDGGENRGGTVLAEIHSPSSYIHSFGMTQNYLVFVQPPLFFGLNGLSIKANKGLVEAMRWDPASPTKVFIIDRLHGGGVVKTYELPAFFFFHQIHSWEERTADGGVDVCMRVPLYPNADIINRFYLHGRGHSTCSPDTPTTIPRLKVIRLGRVTEKDSGVATIQDDRFPTVLEMPNINYRAVQRHSNDLNHVYGLSYRDGGSGMWMDTIMKLDYRAGRVAEWWEAGCYPSEPVFVPRPGSTEEDDPVILSVVLNQQADTSFLLVIDAATFKEISRATYDGRIPMSLHGAFTPTTEGGSDAV